MTITAEGQTVTRTVKKGQPWEHLIMVRSRRTHWVNRPRSARAAVAIDAYGSTYPIEATISVEGGILLYLSAADTAALPVGDLPFDVIANFWSTNTPDYPSGTYFTDYPVKAGVLHVVDYEPITPESDEPMSTELQFNQYEDFTRYIVLPDAAGLVETVTDAYLVAKDAAGVIVFSLDWANPALQESAIALLPPNKRGYIGPPLAPEFSMTLHVSNLAVIPAGRYAYQVYAQTTNSIDWTVRLQGSMVVGAGSAPPT